MNRCLEEMKSSGTSHHLISVLFGNATPAELDPSFSSHLMELSDKVYTHIHIAYMNQYVCMYMYYIALFPGSSQLFNVAREKWESLGDKIM